MVQRDHKERDVAAEVGNASGAVDDDMRTAGGTTSSELCESFEESSRTFPADLWVVNGQFGHNKGAADSSNDDVDEFPVFALKALAHGNDIVRVAWNEFKIWGGIGREDGGELGRGPTKGDALMAGSKRTLERREANAGAGAEEGNGLGVATHCLSWLCEVLVTESEISQFRVGISEIGLFL